MLCVVYKILDEKIKILPTKKAPENVPFIIVLKTNTLIAVLTIKNETEAASFLTRFNFIPLFILLQWELKGTKMDTVIRQATEVGVSHIIPVFGEYSIPKVKNENENLIRNSVSAEDVIPIKTYAFLLMKAFDVKGGMMYRIYPCPRYAYRDLRYLAVIQGKNNPTASMTGTTMLQIFSRIDMVQGGEQ